MKMKNIFILLLLLLCAVLSMAQNNRVISEGSGSNQDLEYNSATRILSITNGTGDTLPVMLGATAGTAGEAGLVPKPLAGEENLFLRGDGTFANPSTGGDNWGSQVVQKTTRLSGDGTAGTPLDIAQQSATPGQVLKWNGSSWVPDNDTDTNTDAQTLSIASNNLSISGGNGVSLSPYLDNTDGQTLSLAANTLSISGGNGVSLAGYLDNTDAQTLTFTESTRVLTISGGNAPDLSEGIQEEVNALIVAGTGISKSYNDGANTLTISATSTGDNIYNIDGALTDDRQLNTSGYELDITTSSSATTQRGLVVRSGYSAELANHFPLTIVAGPQGTAADSVWFFTYDTNLLIGTNTNGLRYGSNNTFTDPRHIVDKQYVDAAVSGISPGPQSDISYAVMRYGTISGISVGTSPVKIAGTGVSSGGTFGGWTFSTITDDMSYSGSTAYFQVTCNCTADLATLKVVTLEVYKEGTPTGIIDVAQEPNDTNTWNKWSASGVISVASGDSIDLRMYDSLSSSSVNVKSCTLTLVKLPGQD